jgi:hypothetical protein
MVGEKTRLGYFNSLVATESVDTRGARDVASVKLGVTHKNFRTTSALARNHTVVIVRVNIRNRLQTLVT